jgi:hypothetical protein
MIRINQINMLLGLSKGSVAEPHHFYAAPVPSTNFYAAQAPAPTYYMAGQKF